MAGAGQNVAGLAMSTGTVDTGFRAEESLTALDKLSKAYRDGVVGYQDIMGLISKPAEVMARMETAKDQTSAARENMRVRPLETEDKIGELGSRAQLRPKITALESAKLDAGQKDALFRETSRPMEESVATGVLREKQSGVDTADATRADRAAAAKSTARAGALKATGEVDLLPGQIENEKRKQKLETAAIERELKDPFKRRPALVDALTKLGVDFNPETDSDEVLTAKYREAKKAADQSEIEKKRAEAGFTEGPKRAEALRKEIGANDSLKDYRTTATALSGLESTLSGDKPSGPKDIAAVYQFIKVLDPNSVVKEGEVTLVRGAVPGMDRLGLLVDKFKSGTALTPETRQQYLEVARELAAAKTESARSALQPYLETARQSGIPLEQVFSPDERRLLQSRVGRHGGEIPAPGAQAAPAPASLPPGVRKLTLTTGQVVYVDQQDKVVSVGQ